MAETPVLGHIFKHEPLDQTRPGIRVFQILPGTGTIRCLMKQVDLDSERTACSYVWGDSEPSQLILINERLFPVRQNLHDLLLQMRKDNFLNPLWVDALYVDQSNTSERNNQVQQMGSIYRDARAVVSWLGQGNASAAQFMQFARIISKEVTDKRADRLGTTKSTNSKVLFYLSVHRYRWEFAEFYQSVITFCHLKYFTRTWIVQEVLLAPTVHTAIYGDINVAWVDLKHIVLTCIKMIRNELFQSPVLPFFQTSIDHPQTADTSSVLALITKFEKTKCSDPRDHVFALHSLWDSGTFPIRVDYNLSSFALFLKFASWLLTSVIQPMSSIISLIDVFELEPEDFANGGELYGAEQSKPVTISAAWSREIDMGELSKYRAMRLATGGYEFSERTTAHDFQFCACEHCIHLNDLPETTVFREYILRSQDHDRTTRTRMDEEIYFVQIIGYKTYWGIVEGDLQDSDAFLVITPVCLNRASELPRVDERDGKLAISLSLGCLFDLFNHLRPDQVADREGYVWERQGYWGIDCNKHEYIYDDGDASIDNRDQSIPTQMNERIFWGRRRWRKEMRKTIGARRQ